MVAVSTETIILTGILKRGIIRRWYVDKSYVFRLRWWLGKEKMVFRYCPDCEKSTGHKRALGFGTFFMVIITGGLWLLTIPFYPSRCIVCGSQKIALIKSPKPFPNNIINKKAETHRKNISAKYVKCPFCDKLIHRIAVRCRHCGREIAQNLKRITPLKENENKAVDGHKKSRQSKQNNTYLKVFYALIFIAMPFLFTYAFLELKYPSKNEQLIEPIYTTKEKLSANLAKRILKEQSIKSAETQNKLRFFLKISNPRKIDKAHRLLTERLKEINMKVINKVVKSNTLNNFDEQEVLEPLRYERSKLRKQLLMLKEAEQIGKKTLYR